MTCPICNGASFHERTSTIGLDPDWQPIAYRRLVFCGYCPAGREKGGRIPECCEKRVRPRRRFTEAEQAEIQIGLESGLTHEQIAKALRSNVRAIQNHLYRLPVGEAA